METDILIVDDEPAVLKGYQRLLSRQFQLHTATSAAEGLAKIEGGQSYAVVVADMRMPMMDGAQFLSRVKTLAPDTIRILLTGDTDLANAVIAVNEGNIFRFLTKPCTKDVFAKALNAALVQYRLVTAEKELLERTLRGSIQVLTEVLSLVNPAAFGRALRVRRYIHQIVTRLSLGSAWRFEVAGMMSQLGCVTLHPDTIAAVYGGRKLSPDEQIRFDAHPLVARDLLGKIPRMEPIAWMVAHQNTANLEDDDTANSDTAATTMLGAEILRSVLAFDEFVSQGASASEALAQVRARFKNLDATVAQAIAELEVGGAMTELRQCSIRELSSGMVIHREVRTHGGELVVDSGQEVNVPLLLKLRNYLEKDAIDENVTIVAAHSQPLTVSASAGG